MRIDLSVKLGIAVIIVFGFIITGMLLYPLLRSRWYEKKLFSKDESESDAAIRKLLTLGARGEKAVSDYFEREDSGWGKPQENIVLRVHPALVTLQNSVRKQLEFEVKNIGPKDVEVRIDKGSCIYSRYINIEFPNQSFSCISSGSYIKKSLVTVKLSPGESANFKFSVEAVQDTKRIVFYTYLKNAWQGDVIPPPRPDKIIVSFLFDLELPKIKDLDSNYVKFKLDF